MPTYRAIGATDVATVDCHKQVRSWRLLRALMEFLIPTCNCAFIENYSTNTSSKSLKVPNTINTNSCTTTSPTSSSTSFITGTIFGYRSKGKVKFCIQTSPSSTTPLLLLELAVPTTRLAREMRGGLLRIALECNTSNNNNNNNNNNNSSNDSNSNNNATSLLEMPVWRMYCNGRRVGYALRRRKPSKADMDVMSKMTSVVVGAGVIEGKDIGCDDDDIMYMRGNFERVRGSSDAESFHLIDPDGNINQDLSIFFLRSS